MIEDHLINIEKSIAAIRAESIPSKPDTNIRVDNQTSLQNAIDNLPAGSTILVKPGTYDSVILRNGKRNLTIKPDTTLGSGRVENEWADALIKIKSFKCEPRAEGYTLIGFKFLPGPVGVEIVALGNDKEVDPLNSPNDIKFIQCIASANPDLGGKRGFRFNCRRVEVIDSIAAGFWYNSDSQAIMCYNGPGPYIIHNNYLEASGENFMIGGADSLTEAMQPRYLKFTNNHCYKPESWITKELTTVKNLFEVKDCLESVIQNNLFEGNWKDGQVGYAILFTPRNQNNREPFTVVRNVNFSWNVVRNSGAGINILGDDNLAPSQKTENISIANNLIYDIDGKKVLGNAGRLFLITRSPRNVLIENNTCLGNKLNSFIDIENTPEKLFVLNNIFTEGNYGLKTTKGQGMTAFQQSTIESEFRGNVIIPSNINSINYGTGNQKITNAVGMDFKSLVSAGVVIESLRQRVVF